MSKKGALYMGLKQVRERKGLSQSQLAIKSGVNLRMIQNYEQGAKNINTARLLTIVELAQALGCSVCDILTDENLINKLKAVL